MLHLEIPDVELFDERTNEFIVVKGTVLRLEHSLVSISKWESKWKKPFLSNDKKTYEESLDYVKCMTLNQNVDDVVYLALKNEDWKKINEYCEDPMTATWFSKRSKRTPNRETITAEILYYYMITLNIPFECQKWHLNRLLTLIRVCNEKNSSEKMSKREILAQNRKLNEARRKASGSKG